MSKIWEKFEYLLQSHGVWTNWVLLTIPPGHSRDYLFIDSYKYPNLVTAYSLPSLFWRRLSPLFRRRNAFFVTFFSLAGFWFFVGCVHVYIIIRVKQVPYSASSASRSLVVVFDINFFNCCKFDSVIDLLIFCLLKAFFWLLLIQPFD